ncbi:MAG: hypothetical protein WDN69_35395 [Aliidongia sp.]
MQEIENQTLKPVKYYVAHDPKDDNYSHSEIKVKKDEVILTKSSQISDTAKKEFRQTFSDRAAIMVPQKYENLEQWPSSGTIRISANISFHLAPLP